MKHPSPSIAVALVAALSLLGCGIEAPGPRIGQQVFERPHVTPVEDPTVLLAADDQGRLVLADPGSGHILASLPDAAPTGLAWDPLSARGVAIRERDEWSHVDRLDVPAASGRWAIALTPGFELEGPVRAWPVREGTIVFERAYGDRWRLVPLDGSFAPSVAGPRPLALRRLDHDRLGVIAARGDELVIASLSPREPGLFVDTRVVPARLEQAAGVWLGGVPLVVGVEAGAVVVVDQDSEELTRTDPMGAADIAGLTVLGDPTRPLLAVSLTSPATLVVLALEPESAVATQSLTSAAMLARLSATRLLAVMDSGAVAYEVDTVAPLAPRLRRVADFNGASLRPPVVGVQLGDE